MNAGFDKKYGKFIVDFANAEGTENALLACFDNLQQNFQFPPDFDEMAKNLFPSINVISVLLDNHDKKLLEQIFKKRYGVSLTLSLLVKLRIMAGLPKKPKTIPLVPRVKQ